MMSIACGMGREASRVVADSFGCLGFYVATPPKGPNITSPLTA